MLCGWAAEAAPGEGEAVVARMGRALRVDRSQLWASWSLPGLALGILEGGYFRAGAAGPPARELLRPAVSPDGRCFLWLAGEIYDSGGLVPGVTAGRSHTGAFRQELLLALLARGIEAVAELDGEYQLALWDSAARELTLANDRFGALPLYWADTQRGLAFAGGVRGVLMAPGVPADPDPEALREAVSFGGFRLGDRTQIAAVKMLPGASLLRIGVGQGGRAGQVVPGSSGSPPSHPSQSSRPSWRWRDLEARPERPLPDMIAEADSLWRNAVLRRLDGAARPGQTLSGGLDSRAILAVAAPAAPGWTALTYGLAGCDDARYAQRAAVAAGAAWAFHPLYAEGTGGEPGWLEQRSRAIQETDGLIDLHDLLHLESLPLQRQLFDVHLCGYIGDAVAGPTFNDVETPEAVLAALPWYGGPLALPEPEARERAREMIEELAGAPARFALFAHKLPQSTNRWSAAWRPWLRVRRPFTDLAFFDFFQGLPARVRGELRLYHRWLRALYPALFAAIPNQATGLPVLAPAWRLTAARARRFAWRRLQPGLARLGLPAHRRLRSYTADEAHWRHPTARQRIAETILRPGSLARDLFGDAPLRAVLAAWFDHAQGPAQVIGALYVHEHYHQHLSSHLRAAAPDPA